MLRGRTPLGWLQLVHHKGRFAMAIAGVAFAGSLVFMQLGFLNMLLDTTVTIHKQLDAEVVVMSRDGRDMANPGSFPRRRLLQALGVEGVTDAEALYLSSMSWIRPDDGETGNVLVMALRPDFSGFVDPDVATRLPELTVPGSLLFDRRSRGDYAAFIARIAAGQRPQTEIAGKRVTVEGSFAFGSSFATEAIVIASGETLSLLDESHAPGSVSLGLVQVAPDADPEAVVAALNALFADGETLARTMEDFIAYSRARLADDSPVSIVFSFGAVMGLLVGTVIVVQILSTDVQDHLAEYATFKAMGFTTGRLLGVVYEQSAILTVCGFLPGLALSFACYELLSSQLAMDMTMTWERILLVLGLTVAMCALSGSLALRRVVAADPAEVF
ncbi:MAG: ABC transporter permease DevC [Rhodospirillales bacterium]